jgi:uncharacterized membrane protein
MAKLAAVVDAGLTWAAALHEMTKATKELNEIIRSAGLEPA